MKTNQTMNRTRTANSTQSSINDDINTRLQTLQMEGNEPTAWGLTSGSANHPAALPLQHMAADGSAHAQPSGSHLNQQKLRTGEDRDRAGATPVAPSKANNIAVTGVPVKLEEALTEHAFSTTPLLTDLINPAKVDMDDDTRSRLTDSRRVGGQLAFNAVRFSVADGEDIHALRIVDTKTSSYQMGSGATLAYWAPQGGYVDIPAHPKQGEPVFVLTPGFSGCSLVADKLNDNTIRVRHVQGGKEDVEYNNLPETEHGQGMINKMEYRDYGYHHDEQGGLKENITGSAFMTYHGGKWDIKYQSLANAPGIVSLKETSVGFFAKQPQLTSKIHYSPGKKVVQTGSMASQDTSGVTPAVAPTSSAQAQVSTSTAAAATSSTQVSNPTAVKKRKAVQQASKKITDNLQKIRDNWKTVHHIVGENDNRTAQIMSGVNTVSMALGAEDVATVIPSMTRGYSTIAGASANNYLTSMRTINKLASEGLHLVEKVNRQFTLIDEANSLVVPTPEQLASAAQVHSDAWEQQKVIDKAKGDNALGEFFAGFAQVSSTPAFTAETMQSFAEQEAYKKAEHEAQQAAKEAESKAAIDAQIAYENQQRVAEAAAIDQARQRLKMEYEQWRAEEQANAWLAEQLATIDANLFEAWMGDLDIVNDNLIEAILGDLAVADDNLIEVRLAELSDEQKDALAQKIIAHKAPQEHIALMADGTPVTLS